MQATRKNLYPDSLRNDVRKRGREMFTFVTNLREEVYGLLRKHGKAESDIIEVLIADDDDQRFVRMDPEVFLEKAGETVFLTDRDSDSLRELRIRGKDFEICTEMESSVEGSMIQLLKYRAVSDRGSVGKLLSAGYDGELMKGCVIEEDVTRTDDTIMDRKMDRLIELARDYEVLHMTVFESDGFGVGRRTVIQFKTRHFFGSRDFQRKAIAMLGVNVVVENLTGLTTPLEGETIYGSGSD